MRSIYFITIIAVFTSCGNMNTQDKNVVMSNDVHESAIEYVGKVVIDTPILLKFEENVNGVLKFNHVLIDKENLNILNTDTDSSFSSCLNQSLGLMFEPNRFQCVLNNYESLYNHDVDYVYENISPLISNSVNDTIWQFEGAYKPVIKRSGQWHYQEIIDRKFLHFTVKGKLLSLCTSRDLINPFESLPDSQFNVFVPMSWER